MGTCLICGSPTERSHKKSKDGTYHDKKYCSDACYRKARCNDYQVLKCKWCGKEFKQNRGRFEYCSKSCAARYNGAYQTLDKYKRDKHKRILYKEYKETLDKLEELRFRLEHEKECAECGQFFVAKFCTQLCCSEICSKRRENRMKENRLKKNGKPDASITLAKVYLRDKGICQLCGREIDFECDSNSNYYPSIDHIIPIAKGGMHTWDNVQLACRICNSIKSDHTDEIENPYPLYEFLH